MSEAAALRSRSETLAAAFPPLLAAAEHLAATVMLGEHGRRRAGHGDAFWQYRPARSFDEARAIDWRRSARGDVTYVAEREWQVAQSVTLWCDGAASMAFGAPVTKRRRAAELTLALALLLLRGGERVGLADIPPRRGRGQATRLAQALVAGDAGSEQAAGQSAGDASAVSDVGVPDFGVPDLGAAPRHGRAVLVSDFLGDPAAIETALTQAAGRGIGGLLVQVLAPEEVEFPFRGRTVFRSMAGALRHDTLQAADLRDRYLARLADRQDHLSHLARQAGWRVILHRTDAPATSALLALWRALDGASGGASGGGLR